MEEENRREDTSRARFDKLVCNRIKKCTHFSSPGGRESDRFHTADGGIGEEASERSPRQARKREIASFERPIPRSLRIALGSGIVRLENFEAGRLQSVYHV